MTAPRRWFDLMIGDSRLGACATEGCGGQPTKRLESGGVGSNYCSGCAAKIEALSAVVLPDELEGGDLAVSKAMIASAVKNANPKHKTMFVYVDDARNVIEALSQAHSTIAALRAERDEAVDRAKVWEHYWQHEVKVKGEVISWCKDYQAKLETAEAQLKRLTEEKEALRAKMDKALSLMETALLSADPHRHIRSARQALSGNKE